jgi:serine/threonine protein kinase
MSTDERTNQEKLVKKDIEVIQSQLFDLCLDSPAAAFQSYLDNVQIIGSGTFGNIYLAELNGNKMAVKEITMTRDQYKTIKEKEADKNSYVEEYRIMNILNAEVKTACPNFILPYAASICEGCGIWKQNVCFMSFMEPALGNLTNITWFTEEMVQSLLCQLLIAFCSLHLKYGIYHKNINAKNILLVKANGGSYFRYTMNDKEYLVRNYGYLFCIHDFGAASVFTPLHSNGSFYGTRNGYINNTGHLEPIKCEHKTEFGANGVNTISLDPPNVIEWVDGDEKIFGTDNLFSNVSLSPNKQVDLNNLKQFPPFEFFYDLQNLLAMLMGGTSYGIEDPAPGRVLRDITHDGLPGKISEYTETKLRKLISQQFPWDTSSAIYLRADMMLDYFYKNPQKTELESIETFNV